MQMLHIFWLRKKYTQIEIFAKLDTPFYYSYWINSIDHMHISGMKDS